MKSSTIDIMKSIEERLSEKRWRHTLGVAFTSAALAMRWGADQEKAFLAGLLHDLAKEIPYADALAQCEKAGIPIRETERRNPVLLHGKLGAWLSEQEFGISDEDVLNAIRNHTTGRPQMELLEEILFVADYMEPMRDRDTNLAKIRETAFVDLEKTIILITEETLSFLKKTGREIDPGTDSTHRYYCDRYRGRQS